MENVIVQCAWCKKVRADDGWTEVAEEMLKLSQISHGICENCCSILEGDDNAKDQEENR